MEFELKLHCFRDVICADATIGSSEDAFIVCHGFAGSKDEAQTVAVYEDLSTMGYTAIKLTHKTGTQLDLIFQQQASQLNEAALFLRKNKNVKRVHLIGMSMGGSNALVAGIPDSDVSSVLSISAVSDGSKWLKQIHGRDFNHFMNRIDIAEVRRIETGNRSLFSINEVLRLQGKYRLSGQQITKEGQITHVSSVTVKSLANYCPMSVILSYPNKPVMFVHGKKDTLVPYSHTVHLASAYSGPKKTSLVAEMDHDVMSDANIRGRILQQYLKWLKSNHKIRLI